MERWLRKSIVCLVKLWWASEVNKVYFFDLPVYRLSPADYALAREKTISAERAKIITMHPDYEIPDVMDQLT